MLPLLQLLFGKKNSLSWLAQIIFWNFFALFAHLNYYLKIFLLALVIHRFLAASRQELHTIATNSQLIMDQVRVTEKGDSGQELNFELWLESWVCIMNQVASPYCIWSCKSESWFELRVWVMSPRSDLSCESVTQGPKYPLQCHKNVWQGALYWKRLPAINIIKI